METIDIVILVLVLWALFHGWKQGLLREVLSMIGFFLGLFIAYQLYGQFGEFLIPHVGNGMIAKILAFCLIWVAVPILLGLVATLITKIINHIPVVGGVNHLGGSLFSMAKYLILMSVVFGAMNMAGIMDGERKNASKFYTPVASITQKLFQGKHFPKPSAEDKSSDTLWVNYN